MAGALLLQEPPASASVSVTDVPGHKLAGPVMAGMDVIRLTVSYVVTLVGLPNTLA